MKIHIKIITLLIIGCCVINSSFAQGVNVKELTDPVTETGLLRKIMNGIYHTYYSPAYMVNKTPVFAVLKVDIDYAGKVTGMKFSDSATSDFAKTYLNNKAIDSYKDAFEKYAKLKSYIRTSVLIPVSYQYQIPEGGLSPYEQARTLMQFDKQDLEGPYVLLHTVVISVLAKNNM